MIPLRSQMVTEVRKRCSMRFLRVVGAALAVYAVGLALTLGMAAGYRWVIAVKVRPLEVIPVRIDVPELQLTGV